MKTQQMWNGVYPALLTPFTKEDEIDLKMFGKNLSVQVEAGISGAIIAGTLGEASTLTTEEKFRLLQEARQVTASRIPVVLNIAEQVTKDAVAFAQKAEKEGADGLMLLPPMRYRASDREVVTYFKSVANACSLPILIYNNPVDYGIYVTLDMFEELAECKNINAVKESTRDVTNITRMINRFGERYKILGGVDTLAVESQVAGAHGSVAGLVDAFPHETVAIFNLVKNGHLAAALDVYRWFMPLLELDIHPRLVQYIKLAATTVGLSNEYVRAPRLLLDGDERIRVQGIINHAIANRPILPDYLNTGAAKQA